MHPAAADHRRDDLDRARARRAGTSSGSRESTTRSARKPGSSLPRRRSSPASQAGVTVEASSACSTVSACSGRQAGRSSIVRRTPARIPASGSSSSTGASEPFATTRAGVPQRAGTRRRRRAASAQNRSARSRSEGACENCTEQATPSSAKRPHVLGREALRVLDPVAQAERLPGVARRLERVERLAVRPVADRVHRDRPACAGACADDAPRAPRRS